MWINEKTQDEIRLIKENIKNHKCMFSTFVDEKTITCSWNGNFNNYGYPKAICPYVDICDKIDLTFKNFLGIKKR